MPRTMPILASKEKATDKDCKWKDCKKQHKFKIPYPDNGRVTRSGLSAWSHPCVYSERSGLSETSEVLSFAPKYQKEISTSRDATSSMTYKFQRHHIIPCAVYKDLDQISFNLKLLGYDINDEILNGISLPTKPKDMVWHDLQYHRGYHKTYNDKVRTDLTELQDNLIPQKLCTNGEQGKLWDEIQKKVNHYKTKIVKWQILLFPDAKVLRSKAFKKLGISV